MFERAKDLVLSLGGKCVVLSTKYPVLRATRFVPRLRANDYVRARRHLSLVLGTKYGVRSASSVARGAKQRLDGDEAKSRHSKHDARRTTSFVLRVRAHSI
jgi:hypothetical protein